MKSLFHRLLPKKLKQARSQTPCGLHLKNQAIFVSAKILRNSVLLGKMAELLETSKTELRETLADMNLPILNQDVYEAMEEAKKLLDA